LPLFEHNIINYTLTHDYVLGEVVVDITYESDLDKAIKIAEQSAIKFAKEPTKAANKEINVRVKMAASSITLRVRFFAPVKVMQEISSNITRGIFKKIGKTTGVSFAYPHTEVILSQKGRIK